jgi:ribokinase
VADPSVGGMNVCALGSINLDVVCRVARLPAPGETVSALGMNQYAGGKGANQAVASARWGAATTLIGAVGRDDAADFLLAHLADAGVATGAIIRDAEAPTGRGYINVSDAGENMIVVVGGSNLKVTTAQVAAADLASHHIFISQLEVPLDTIEALFGSSAARAGVRILNAAPAALEASPLFALADILVVNEIELARYAGLGEPPESPAEIDRAARGLISRDDQRVVVTLGAAGARVVGPEASIAIAGRRAAVVDTTGAGDCFCGVMAAALSEGVALEDAVAIANAAAAISTEHAGASAPANLRQLTSARR